MENAIVPVETPEKLKLWQKQYARWLAIQTKTVTPDEEQVACTQFKGVTPSIAALKRVKRSRLWREEYERARGEFNEHYLRKAKNMAVRMLPKAVKTYDKALDVSRKAMDDPDVNVALAGVRAASPLLTASMERAIPKKQEVAFDGKLEIQLTPMQMAQLTAPSATVEAEEVPFEIISEEPA
jgi:hypothetical protein